MAIVLQIPILQYNSYSQIFAVVSFLQKYDIDTIKFHIEEFSEEDRKAYPEFTWMETVLKGFNVNPYPSKIHPSLRCFELPFDALSREFFARFFDCISYVNAYCRKGVCRLSQYERFGLELVVDDDTDISVLDESHVVYRIDNGPLSNFGDDED